MGKLKKDFKQRIELLNKNDVGLEGNYYFNQSDMGTSTIIAQITNNNKKVDLKDTSISLNVLRSDGKRVTSVCKVIDDEEGIVELLFTKDMLRTAGLAAFQVTLQHKESVVTSNTFYFTINETYLQEDVGDLESLPLVLQMQSKANEILKNETKVMKRLENLELKIINSEKIRCENEEKREGSYKRVEQLAIDTQNASNDIRKNEENRITNEQGRISEEEKRVKNEKIREENEIKRVNLMDKFILNEKERENIFLISKKNEEERVLNEEKRNQIDKSIKKHYMDSVENLNHLKNLSNEHEKSMEELSIKINNTYEKVITSEKERVESEDKRILEENKRLSAEEIREENEKLRLKAYEYIKDDLEKVHAMANDTKLDEYVDKKVEKKADKEHIHVINDISNLTEILDSKVDKEHKHRIEDIENIKPILENLNNKVDKVELTKYQIKGDYALKTELNSYQEKGDYVEKTLLKEQLSSKLDNTYIQIVDEKISDVENKIKALNGEVHTHKINEIVNLEEALNSKVSKDELNNRLSNLINNEEIIKINSRLDSKANQSSIEDITSELDVIYNRFSKYQLKGDYVEKNTFETELKNIFDNLASNEEIINIQKSILGIKNSVDELDSNKSDTDHKHNYSDLVGLPTDLITTQDKLELEKKINQKSNDTHKHEYNELTNIPTDIVKKNMLKDYIQNGCVKTTDIKGSKGILLTGIKNDVNTISYQYIDSDNIEKEKILGNDFIKSDDLTTLKQKIELKLNDKANLSDLKYKAEVSDLDNKADKEVVEELQKTLDGVASQIPLWNQAFKRIFGE